MFMGCGFISGDQELGSVFSTGVYRLVSATLSSYY